MINPGKPFNIHDYKEVFLRRIWYFIVPFVAILAGAGLYASVVPKEYQATTLILVTPQKVPEDFVRPTVTSRIEDRLQSIGQEITSRTRLEQLIKEFNLYPEKAGSLPREEVIEHMRKNIEVQIGGRQGRGEYQGYFTISYIGKDPQTVTMVTNKLASLFIEENLSRREHQAQGTSEFLNIELKATKAKLEEQEKVVTEFKRKFMGELPEQRDANLRVLDQLQMQSQRIGDSLKSAQDRRVIVQKQLSDFELLSTSSSQAEAPADDLYSKSALPPSPPSPKEKNPYDSQLEQMKNYLVELQAKYTEKHPDILITRKKIADLEAKKAEFDASAKAAAEKEEKEKEEKEKEKEEKEKEALKKSAATKAASARREIRVDPRMTPQYKQIENQLIAVDMEIERLKQEDSKVRAQITQYRERIENTPARELSLTNLTRDYNNTRDTYASLLKKSEEAKQAESLERRQKGEQFKVIDPARLPETPYRPDVRKILLVGLFLGFFSGVAAAFLREQMDRSFRDGEDLQVTLGYKVLANIPRVGNKAG